MERKEPTLEEKRKDTLEFLGDNRNFFKVLDRIPVFHDEGIKVEDIGDIPELLMFLPPKVLMCIGKGVLKRVKDILVFIAPILPNDTDIPDLSVLDGYKICPIALNIVNRKPTEEEMEERARALRGGKL